MRYLIVVVVAVALSVSGCASTNNVKRDKTKSLALQIMQAAGRDKGLKDIEHSMLKEPLRHKSPTDIFALVDAAGTYTNVFTPPPGFSVGSATAIGLLGFFLSGRTQEGFITQLLVWMPASMAKDEEEAKLKMSKILEDAAIKALPEGYTTKEFVWEDQATLGSLSPQRIIKVDGPMCANWSCYIWGDIPSDTHSNWKGKMEESIAPEYVSNTEIKAFRYARRGQIGFNSIVKEYDEIGGTGGHWHKIIPGGVEGFSHKDWYVRISENLPSWAYYYFAPNLKNPDDGITKIPVIFNSGKPLLFIKPDPV